MHIALFLWALESLGTVWKLIVQSLQDLFESVGKGLKMAMEKSWTLSVYWYFLQCEKLFIRKS